MTRMLIFAAGIVALILVIPPGLRTPSPDPRTTADTNPARLEQPSADAMIARTADDAAIARGPEGHFTAQALVNGTSFPMVIDSGATLVVLRREDALAAGISVFPAEFTGSARTAGGTVKTKRVMIDRLRVAGIERRNVAAAVVDADLPTSLLGQSFLAQLDEVRIADDEMILR